MRLDSVSSMPAKQSVPSSISLLPFLLRTSIGVFDPWYAAGRVNLEKLLVLYTTAAVSKNKVGGIVRDSQLLKENNILPGVGTVTCWHRISIVNNTQMWKMLIRKDSLR
jgi:hypothetical protein